MQSAASGGVVLPALLRDPTLFLQFTEDPVEVVGFDLHRFGDFRGRDARVLLDQFHGLVGPGAAATTTTTFPRCRRGRCRFGRASRATASAAAGAARSAARDVATKLGERALEALALLVELSEPFLDQVESLVEYVAGARHFLPFIPRAFCLPGRQLPRSVAESQ